MLFTVGDVPAEPLEISQAAYDPQADYTSISARLYAPDGTLAGDLGSAPFTDGYAEFPWGNVFLNEGVHTLRLVLTGPVGARLNVPALRVVVEPVVSPWHTVSSLREVWDDTPVSDTAAYELLQVSKDACLAYAPLSGPEVPARYRKAQALQAREVWNFAKKNPASGDIGEGMFSSVVYPLDRVIKQVLRPQSALGRIVRA